jgi:signal transduction histidine kinase
MLHISHLATAARQHATLLLYLIITVLSATPQSAASDGLATPVELHATGFHRDLAHDIRYIEDHNKSLTPETALAGHRSGLSKPVTTTLIDFGFRRSTFWLFVPVRNGAEQAATWKLAIDVPNIERLAVYQTHEGADGKKRLRRIVALDEKSPFGARPLPHRNFAVNIRLAAGERADLMLAYSSKQATQLPLFIESPDYFYARVRAGDIHNGALFALLLGMTLVSTIYLMALGFTTAVYYGAYILVSGLYLMHTDGYTFQYLWPSAPWWNSVAIAPIGMVMVACGSLFARAFIEAPRYHRRLNRLLLASVWVAMVLLAVSFVALEFDAYKTATLVFVVAVAVLYLVSGILALLRGHPGAGFFVCGAIAIISSIIFGAVGYLNPGRFNQDIAGHFGRYALLVEGTAFSLAILFNILSIRRDRDMAMRREIKATQERLAVSEALVAAEKNHGRAVALAESRRQRLASAAHDIQQPLSSLRMAVASLGGLDEAKASNVRTSFEYLDRLVQANLEETTPVDQSHDGHMQSASTHEEHFPASVVLANVEAMFRHEAQRKGICLRLVNSTAHIKAEPLVLMRIVSNLVSNALKYTPSGKVLFGCRRQGDRLRIEVLDTGPGMAPDEVGRLLRPYQRASTEPGTGLGLALVQELSDKAGFAFTIDSQPNRGTRAVVSVPLETSSAE